MSYYHLVCFCLPLALLLFGLLLKVRNAKWLSVLMRNDYSWEQVSDHELRPLMRDSLVRIDRDLLWLGFRLHGNFSSVRRGISSTSRCFLNDPGTISVAYTPEITAFHSLLSDGTLVETSTAKKLPEVFLNLPQSSRMWITTVDTQDIDELHQRHLAELVKLESERSFKPVKLEMESLGEFNRYLITLCEWQVFLKGHALLRPAPHSFALPINGEMEFVFPGAKENNTLKTLQRIKKIKKRSFGDYLPATRDDWRALAWCLLFYPCFIVGIFAVKLYAFATLSENTTVSNEFVSWWFPFFTLLGLGIGLLFYCGYRHTMASNKLQ